MDESAWDTVDRLVAWIDESSPRPRETDKLLRIMKLSEEVGEVAAAVLGATGQNPRKGLTHSWDDVQHELCDVILSAMVALSTINPDARKLFAQRLDHVAERSLGQASA